MKQGSGIPPGWLSLVAEVADRVLPPALDDLAAATPDGPQGAWAAATLRGQMAPFQTHMVACPTCRAGALVPIDLIVLTRLREREFADEEDRKAEQEEREDMIKLLAPSPRPPDHLDFEEPPTPPVPFTLRTVE